MPVELNKYIHNYDKATHENEDVVNVQPGSGKLMVAGKSQTPASTGNHAIDAFIAHVDRDFHGQFVAKEMTLAHLRNLKETGAPLRVRDVRNSIEELEAGKADTTAHRKVDLLMVGGGPRSVAQVNAEIDFIAEHRQDFEAIEKLHGKYDDRITTLIVDKQNFKEIGKGNAWGGKHAGMANTGVEFDHEKRFRKLYSEQRADILDAAKKHPLLDLSYRGAVTESKSGRLELERAAVTRNILGDEESNYFKGQLKSLGDTGNSRFYDARVIDDTEIRRVRLPDATSSKPSVAWTDETGKSQEIHAQSVRLNTGTTLVSPLKDKDVEAHSYVGFMNPDDLKAKLDEKGLLDGEGKLKEKVSILTGGSGLSLYDQLTALEPTMGLIEKDPTAVLGYQISDAAKQKYQGAITVTSNTPGKWIAPRHTHGPKWTQTTRPMGDMKEQHALFLHNQGEQVFEAWQDIAEASCAAATGRTPADVREKNLTTEELLERYNNESGRYWEELQQNSGKEAQTLYGARRQAYLSSALGFGMSGNIQDDLVEMEKTAPHTFKGRGGYLMHRAQTKAVTEPGSRVSNEKGRACLEVLGTRMQDITSSPAQIHAFAHKLMDAGVLRYTPGSYDDIKVSETNKDKLVFTDQGGNSTEHDLFIVSKTFSRRANPADQSLSGQVKPVHTTADQSAKEKTASFGEVERHRMLVSMAGERTPVETYGLDGKGVPVGDKAYVGAFAWDVNNRESASQVARGLAYRHFAQEALEAAGYDNPVDTVEELYETMMPGNEEYETEVEGFREAYYEAMQKSVYLKIIEEEAGGDTEKYGELFENGRTSEGRLNSPVKDRYKEAIKLIETYQPSAKSDFFKRFVDSPDWTHEIVYTKAVLLASHKLMETRQTVIAGQTGSRVWA